MKKIGIIIAGVIGLVVLLSLSSSFVESVQGGEIHVKQAAVSGTMSVRSQEGLYAQMFGKITKYFRTAETYLSNDELDGGKGAETNATLVRFGDGGTAEVGSVTQWRLPLGEVEMIKIHRNFRGFNSLAAQVRQWIIEVEKQTASTFRADETYSTRRAEFQQLVSDQIIDGIYATETVEVEVPTNDTNEKGEVIMATVTRVVIKKDDKGFPVIIKPGIFTEYGLTLVNHSIKDIDYDDTIDSLIAQKKKAEQEKAVAITNAEKSIQDALTAKAKGDADIAKAKAAEEVKKITEITRAEKDKAVAILKAEQQLNVAELNKKRATEEAEAELVKRRADAEANALLVKAGLTPLQKAEIDKATAIGVAAELAKVRFPSMMVLGGGENGALNPFDAVGLKSFIEISNDMSGN